MNATTLHAELNALITREGYHGVLLALAEIATDEADPANVKLWVGMVTQIEGAARLAGKIEAA